MWWQGQWQLAWFGVNELIPVWCWEGLGAGGEGADRGWEGWMASPTRWTWVWVNSGSWWWTGRPGMLRFMGSQSRTQLSNWTELNWAEGIWSLHFFPPLLMYHHHSLKKTNNIFILWGKQFPLQKASGKDLINPWEDLWNTLRTTELDLKAPQELAPEVQQNQAQHTLTEEIFHAKVALC